MHHLEVEWIAYYYVKKHAFQNVCHFSYLEVDVYEVSVWNMIVLKCLLILTMLALYNKFSPIALFPFSVEKESNNTLDVTFITINPVCSVAMLCTVHDKA